MKDDIFTGVKLHIRSVRKGTLMAIFMNYLRF